jgi:hypothetical protein
MVERSAVVVKLVMKIIVVGLMVFTMLSLAPSVRAEEQLLRLRTVVEVGTEVVARPTMLVRAGSKATIKIGAEKGAANPRDVGIAITTTAPRGGIVSLDADVSVTPHNADGTPNTGATRSEQGALKIALGARGSYTWPAPKGTPAIKLTVSVDPATSAQVEAMKGNTP